jgi:glycosyltransferase involved in cell wall biosynthesis
MRVLHVIPSVSERSGGPGHAIISMCRSLLEQGTDVLIATTDDGMESGVSSSEIPVSSSGFRVSSLRRLTESESELRKSNAQPRTPNSKLEIANSKLETRNSELESRNSKLEIRNSKLETRNSKLGTRNFFKGVPTIFFPTQWGESFKYSKPLSVWLDANVKEFDVVHIHAVFNHACLAAARACRKHNVPYVVRPLGTLDPWSMQQKPWRKRLFWQLAGKRMLQGASAVHYTAQAEQSATEQSLGLNHGRVIPLGVEINQSAHANDRASVSPELTNLAAHSYVLVLSRLHPKKGLDVFIDAFAAVVRAKEFAAWRLVLAGEGSADYVQSLTQRIAAAQITEKVLFAGWLEGDEKNAFLRRACLLALPSHHENFGLCVMESLAAGVPVLVSPQVNLAAEIATAGAGWIVPANQPDLEAALKEIFSRDLERAKRGVAGKRLAQDFSREHVALRLNELYAAVAAPVGPDAELRLSV